MESGVGLEIKPGVHEGRRDATRKGKGSLEKDGWGGRALDELFSCYLLHHFAQALVVRELGFL